MKYFLQRSQRRAAAASLNLVTCAHRARACAGKVHVILLWLLGVPIPIILIILLIKGCAG